MHIHTPNTPFPLQIGDGLPIAVSLVAVAMGLNLLEVLPLSLPSLDVDVRRLQVPPAAQAYLAGGCWACHWLLLRLVMVMVLAGAAAALGHAVTVQALGVLRATLLVPCLLVSSRSLARLCTHMPTCLAAHLPSWLRCQAAHMCPCH